MTRVLLIRHGETAWNLDRRWQGQADIPLTPAGHRQALALAGRLCALFPALRLYTSDLARAQETARHVAAEYDTAFRVEPRWREMDVGAWTGHSLAVILERFPDDLQRIARGEDVPRGGGETWAALTRRAPRRSPSLGTTIPEKLSVWSPTVA